MFSLFFLLGVNIILGFLLLYLGKFVITYAN